MRRKILSMLTVVMILFMAVGCGGDASSISNETTENKQTTFTLDFKQSSKDEALFQEKVSDVTSVKITLSKGNIFYLTNAAMVKDTLSKKWAIGVSLAKSLTNLAVVIEGKDNSGKTIFKTVPGTIIKNLTGSQSILVEEVNDDESSSTNLPSVEEMTYTLISNGEGLKIKFVINNAERYLLSASSSTVGSFSRAFGYLTTTEKAEFEVVYVWGTDETELTFTIKLTNSDENSKELEYIIVKDSALASGLITVNFPPSVKINVKEELIPSNTYTITAIVTDEESASWTYVWSKIRGAKVLASDLSTPDILEIAALSNGEDYPLCFALTVTDDGGASSSDDYCIKHADNGYVGLKKTGQTKSYATDGTEVTDGSVQDDGFYQKGLTPQYTRDDVAQTVTDHVTGLVWQDDENVKTNTYTWEEAKSYCESKGNGWYLPSIEELSFSVEYGNEKFINTTFSNTKVSYYWSSSTYASGTSNAWFVYFYDGNVGGYDKDYGSYVRCVRDGQ